LLLAVGKHFPDDPADARGHVGEGFVPVGPVSNRPRVLRQRLKLAEGGALPVVAVTEDDRDDARLTRLVPLHRSRHFDVVAVVGGEKIGADEQEDDVGRLQVLVYLLVPFLAGVNAAVAPVTNHAVTPEHDQVSL
jgi:hypothetical protein